MNPQSLTPKQMQAMDDIISSANPLFFARLARLLGVSTPIEKEAELDLLEHILRAWEAMHQGVAR